MGKIASGHGMGDEKKKDWNAATDPPTDPPTDSPKADSYSPTVTDPPTYTFSYAGTYSPTVTECFDVYTSCPTWYQYGYCNDVFYSDWMRKYCKQSCGVF